MPKAEIDFTNTEGSGRLKDGTYRARLESVEQKDGRDYPLWVWTFTSLEPETAGRQSQHTTSLSPKAAFFVRQVLEALGADVPGSMAKINTDDYLGREAMILVIQDGTFVGKNDGEEHPSYKIDRVFPVLGNQPAAYHRKPDGNPAPGWVAPADDRNAVKFDGDDIPF
jgi:hypothetical protein